MPPTRTLDSTTDGMLLSVDRWSSDQLVGRTSERAQLAQALRDAVAGRVRVGLVSGEAGVGKTRLVDAFATDAQLAGARVLTGSCLDVGEGILPYAPFVEALRGLVAELPADELDGLVGEGRGDLGRLLPEMAAGTPAAPQAAPAAQLFELILGVLTRLSSGRPVVLVIEDFHWADRSTMDLVAFLERNLRAAVLLLLTVRSDELHRGHPVRARLAELDRHGLLTRIDLAPLDRRATSELITDLLRKPPAPRLVGQVYDRSGGNPFHIEMLIAADTTAPGRLPERLRDMLVSQIDALPPEAQRVVQVAAVVGRRIDSALLTEVASATGSAPDQINGGLREAVSRHLLVASAADGGYAFRHALLQEAVYDDMLPDDRSRVHAAVARILESRGAEPSASDLAELAHHWFAAHDQQRALGAAVRAAAAASERFAPAEAVAQFDRALSIWDQVPDAEAVTGMQRSDVLIATAKAAWLVGEPVLAAKHMRAAIAQLDRATQRELIGELLLRLAWFVYFGAGTQQEGDALVNEAAALVPVETPTPVRSAMLSALAYIALRSGDDVVGIRLSRDALDVALRAGDDQLRRLAQVRIGQGLVAMGKVDEGVEQAMAALEPETQLDVYRLGQIYINVTDTLILACRPDDVVTVGREGVRRGLRQGARGGFVPYIIGNIGEALIEAGRWTQADEAVTEALEMDPGVTSERVVRQLHARLLFERGQVELAHHECEDLLELAGADDPQVGGPLADSMAACVFLRRGIDQARQVVDDGLGWVQDAIRYASVLFIRGLDIEEAALERGDPDALDRARGLLAQLEDLRAAQAGAAPLVEARLATARATATRVLGGDSLAASTEAVQRWEALGMRPGLTGALVGGARAHLAAGDRPAAAVSLRRARELTDQMGATLRREQVDALAARAGLHLADGSAARDGHVLTRREREVLELLAEGSTNRQIAERLFIGEKTASVHVSNILAKLGVPNRGQAVVAAKGRGLV